MAQPSTVAAMRAHLLDVWCRLDTGVTDVELRTTETDRGTLIEVWAKPQFGAAIKVDARSVRLEETA